MSEKDHSSQLHSTGEIHPENLWWSSSMAKRILFSVCEGEKEATNKNWTEGKQLI
jgi:hypothetical protein